MSNHRLTKSVCDEAEALGSRRTLWDSGLPGFGLRIGPTGAKTWVVKYRVNCSSRNSPGKWLTLGGYQALDPVQARAAAKKVLAEARLGLDPASVLAAKRLEKTVAEVIELYAAEGLVVSRGKHIGRPMKPLTAQYTMARLRHHVLPILGNLKVAAVNERDIESLDKAVTSGKTASDQILGPRRRIVVRGGEGAARKVIRDLSAVFSFAKRHKLVLSNPVTNAAVRKTDEKRTEGLSLDEVQRLGRALDELEAEGTNPKALNIARLWVLTGCRRNEVAGLKWGEVDFERGVLCFEDTKTGKSVRPLAAAAAALLKALSAVADPGDKFVFPAERGRGFYQGTKGVWPSAIKRASLPGATPHVLRHTLGRHATAGGESLLLLGAVLGHANPRSTAIYAHVSRDPAKLAADRITGALAAALNGRT